MSFLKLIILRRDFNPKSLTKPFDIAIIALIQFIPRVELDHPLWRVHFDELDERDYIIAVISEEFSNITDSLLRRF
jgi:hypothetical protein